MKQLANFICMFTLTTYLTSICVLCDFCSMLNEFIVLLFIVSGSSPKPSGNESVEVADGGKGYVYPPENYHDFVNHGLHLHYFRGGKTSYFEQALQHLNGRNGPKAKRTIDMISNPPPLFESDYDDSTTLYLGGPAQAFLSFFYSGGNVVFQYSEYGKKQTDEQQRGADFLTRRMTRSPIPSIFHAQYQQFAQ